MIVSVYVPLLAATLLGWAAPWAVSRLAPSTATRALTCVAIVTAALTVGSLALLATGGALKLVALPEGDTTQLAWVDLRDSVPGPVGAIAVLTLLGMLAHAIHVAARDRAVVAAVRAVARRADRSLLVVQDPASYAYAVPVNGGVVVASTGLLHRLPEEERRALLAHEQAHLRHHHHRYRTAVAIAAAVNPALLPLRATMKLQIERWADEAAAADTSRQVTARSLARAAITAPRPVSALAFALDNVTQRVHALQSPAPRSRWRRVLPAAAVSLIGCAALADAAAACWHLLATALG